MLILLLLTIFPIFLLILRFPTTKQLLQKMVEILLLLTLFQSSFREELYGLLRELVGMGSLVGQDGGGESSGNEAHKYKEYEQSTFEIALLLSLIIVYNLIHFYLF